MAKKAENKPKIKQSETLTIKRSQINFAPYNPKKHSKEAIEEQKRNFKSVGFLGGIIWNKNTHNLISGHKRVMAMDLVYHYDGTAETDYDIKVEAIELTDKQEKEQNIYMDARATNTKQDLELLAVILPEIELRNTGLDEYDIQMIETVVPNFNFGSNETIKDDNAELRKDYDQAKAQVKNLKKSIKNNVSDKQTPTHFTVTFKTYDEKAQFLENIGINGDEIFITSERFVKKLYEQ